MSRAEAVGSGVPRGCRPGYRAGAGADPQRTVDVYAAGSLRAAFETWRRRSRRSTRIKVKPTFGASGLLKDRIVAGESPQVFASANMEHPEALVAAGRAPSVSAFARNALCVLATPSFSLQGKSLALRLLDADVRVGTSTPKADPSGDYAFTMFDRIESSGAPARARRRP